MRSRSSGAGPQLARILLCPAVQPRLLAGASRTSGRTRHASRRSRSVNIGMAGGKIASDTLA